MFVAFLKIVLDARPDLPYSLLMPATNAAAAANFLALCALMGEEATPEFITGLDAQVAAASATHVAELAEDTYRGFLADARRPSHRLADYGRDHSMWARSAE